MGACASKPEGEPPEQVAGNPAAAPGGADAASGGSTAASPAGTQEAPAATGGGRGQRNSYQLNDIIPQVSLAGACQVH